MIGLLEPREDGRRVALSLLGRVLARSRVASPLCPSPSEMERGRGGSRWGEASPRRILVIRPDHLGDLLFLTPALRRLGQTFPNAEIVGLVGPWGQPVLATNPYLSRLIAWKFPWFDRQPRRSLFGPYVSLIRLAMRLHREEFDLAFQFRPDFWWGALAVRLAGVPEQVGYDVPVVRPFLDRAIPVQHGLHAALENLRLVEAVAGPGEASGLEFRLRQADERRANELLRSVADQRCLVGIQAGAGAPVKLWPLDRLATVGRGLRDRFGATLVVIGGESEREAVATIVREIGDGALGLAGVTTIGELAAVLARCQLVVGPDSGPLHLAVAVGTPTVHLFGPADAIRFGPYGDPARHRVVHTRWPCSPCDRLDFVGVDLERHDCMSRIEVDDVLDVASELLGRLSPGDTISRPETTRDG